MLNKNIGYFPSNYTQEINARATNNWDEFEEIILLINICLYSQKDSDFRLFSYLIIQDVVVEG